MHSLATWSLVMMDSVCLLFVVGLFCLCVHCRWELSISATACLDCHCMYSVYVLHVCWAVNGPVSCAGSPESPEEMAVSQVVETMDSEVPPQQTEQTEPSRGGVQPHLEEERCVGWGKAHVHFYRI